MSQPLVLTVQLPSGNRDTYWVRTSDRPRALFQLIEANQGLPSDMICLVVANRLRPRHIDAATTETLAQCMGADRELLVVLKGGRKLTVDEF